MSSYFPLTPGQHGEAVRDLQRRLGAAGFAPAAGVEPGLYCMATDHAVRSFQRARGLHEVGGCDELTWSALIEAGFQLGDRPLLLTSPNMRGDDVVQLQHHLARLGFDCGRVDGIFGPRSAHALRDFQDNCGLPADAVCGPDTVQAIHRVIGQTGNGPGVGAVRDAERLRALPAALAQCRVVIGQFGGLSGLSRLISRELRHQGAAVISLDEPDAVTQARAANHFDADLYLGFEARLEAGLLAHFYQVPQFASIGGQALAEMLVGRLSTVPTFNPSAHGMRLPILRETRMPAVLVTAGPIHEVMAHAPELAAACIDAVGLWVTSRRG